MKTKSLWSPRPLVGNIYCLLSLLGRSLLLPTPAETGGYTEDFVIYSG